MQITFNCIQVVFQFSDSLVRFLVPIAHCTSHTAPHIICYHVPHEIHNCASCALLEDMPEVVAISPESLN